MADVDHLGGLALDHGGAQNAVLAAGDLDVEPFLDDVDDLVDHEPHRAAVIGKHQDRLGACGLDADPVHLHQRHQLVAVLHHVAAVGEFDLVGGELFQPGDEPERHRLGLGGAGAEHQQRGQLFGGGGAGRRVLVGDLVGGSRPRPPTPWRCRWGR